MRFHGNRHPREMGEEQVARFLQVLVEERHVSASTQGQALAALLFLDRNVLGRPLQMAGLVPKGRGVPRIPVVLDRGEVQRVLAQLSGAYHLVGLLLYGSGLRLLECLSLRVKDIDLILAEIRVRRGKGQKDRVTTLPEAATALLRDHLERVQARHRLDLVAGAGAVALPEALARKLPGPERSWVWQWVFPATRQYADPTTGELRRHHLHPYAVQGDDPGGGPLRHRQAGRAVTPCGLPLPRTH